MPLRGYGHDVRPGDRLALVRVHVRMYASCGLERPGGLGAGSFYDTCARAGAVCSRSSPAACRLGGGFAAAIRRATPPPQFCVRAVRIRTSVLPSFGASTARALHLYRQYTSTHWLT
jgi:hypothetical protein